MQNYVDGLSLIARKTPVVATHVGVFSNTSVRLTLARYEEEALTYVRPTDISSYQQKFITQVLEKKTAIGCIVAPFGYGKTSAAIDTWKACQERNLLAVPPFSCSSIAEMGQAIASGVSHQLGENSLAAQKVSQTFQSYLVSSAQRMAEQDVAQYKIDYEVALQSIEDKISRGYLHIEATGNHLLAFLEELTGIVLTAGYSGLVVIVDEFQQFLGNINKAVITNFRTLVWGLRTRGKVPFGLLITMDPDTERNLSERAGDILHRIKEDALYLDFSDTYDREFARLLWARYAESFNFVAQQGHVVDHATLEALGQICERHDLSNGPRTVIDVFQRIAHLYQQRQKPYGPIDLINDFMTGQIRFDGDRSKIASLVTELTGYEYIKASPERFHTLKLISAFPRGCSREVAESYGFGQAYDQLADALRGEVLTELPEGMALIDLQKVGKPQNKLNILLKKYWMQITEEEIISDRAVLLFLRYAVAPLFPPYRSVLSGWTTVYPDFRLTHMGGYLQIFRGTLFEEFPQRRVCVQVCRRKEQIVASEYPVDIHFVFILQLSSEVRITPTYDRENHKFVFGILIDHPFNLPLPREIRWIQDYLRPVTLSPGVLLSLLDYIQSHAAKIDGITENELQRIGSHQRKLNDFLLAMTYGEELFSGSGLLVIARGEQALRQVLFKVLQEAYPNYQTLINSPQWETLINTYLEALDSVNPLQRQGLETLNESKTHIAALFGLRNHAGFESYVRQFGPLLVLEAWSGDVGSVRFCRHPGEEWLLNWVTFHRDVSQQELQQVNANQGYLTQETDYLLRLLKSRGHIEFQSGTNSYRPAQTRSVTEILVMAEEIVTQVSKIQEVTDLKLLRQARTQAQTVLELCEAVDILPSDLLNAQVRLLQAEQSMQTAMPELGVHLRNELTSFRTNLYERLDALRQALPISVSGLRLDAHINGAQRSLIERRAVAAARLEKIGAVINRLLEQISKSDLHQTGMAISGTFAQVRSEFRTAITLADEILEASQLHHSWLRLADQLHRTEDFLFTLQTMHDVRMFQQRLGSIVEALMQGLAVSGLARYSELYTRYAPQAEALYIETQAVVQAVALQNSSYQPNVTAQQQSGGTSSASSDSRELQELRQLILTLANSPKITLGELVQTCAISKVNLLELLLQLEADGRVSINIHLIEEL